MLQGGGTGKRQYLARKSKRRGLEGIFCAKILRFIIFSEKQKKRLAFLSAVCYYKKALRHGAKSKYGGIAQLGERLNGIQEVSGSIPLISTKKDLKS